MICTCNESKKINKLVNNYVNLFPQTMLLPVIHDDFDSILILPMYYVLWGGGGGYELQLLLRNCDIPPPPFS